MKLLFICNQNQHRSKTAEIIFNGRYETKSAGLFNEKPVSEEEMEWADAILVMEDFQRAELGKRFPSLYLQKRVLSLEIPDIYQFNQPELIKLLKRRMNKFH